MIQSFLLEGQTKIQGGFKMKTINGVEWNEKGLVMSKNNVGQVFLLGCAEYPKDDGETVAVFFTADCAFLFFDSNDGVLWNMEEMKNAYVAKDSDFRSGDFPNGFEEYREICTAVNDDGEDFVSDIAENVLTYYGIGKPEVAEDIKKRLASLASFRVEKDMLA